MFSQLYRHTVNNFPQAFLFLIIGIYSIAMFLVMAVRSFENRAEKLKLLKQANGEEMENIDISTTSK